MTFFFIEVLALESCFYYGERFSLWGLLGQGKAVEGIRVANEEVSSSESEKEICGSLTPVDADGNGESSAVLGLSS